jgi:hypothetical protein
MSRPELSDIDLNFRPRSYFWPLGLETHLLARIKGAERKAALKRLIYAGQLDEIPDLLAQSALSEADRRALGRFHPAFMSGEYLADLKVDEVMIARITIASTTRDVTCVYARRGKDRIHYRVVDEYGGDTLSGRNTRTSIRPLTLGQLETFFNGAWSIFEVLDANYGDDGYNLDEMQKFVVSIDSEFYPDLGWQYRRRIASWAAEQRDSGGREASAGDRT